jgi:NAD(P) transhydrogenase subunit beta
VDDPGGAHVPARPDRARPSPATRRRSSRPGNRRGLGHAGVDTELFCRDNAMMLFGDVKKMCEDIVTALE